MHGQPHINKQNLVNKKELQIDSLEDKNTTGKGTPPPQQKTELMALAHDWQPRT